MITKRVDGVKGMEYRSVSVAEEKRMEQHYPAFRKQTKGKKENGKNGKKQKKKSISHDRASVAVNSGFA